MEFFRSSDTGSSRYTYHKHSVGSGFPQMLDSCYTALRSDPYSAFYEGSNPIRLRPDPTLFLKEEIFFHFLNKYLLLL